MLALRPRFASARGISGAELYEVQVLCFPRPHCLPQTSANSQQENRWHLDDKVPFLKVENNFHTFPSLPFCRLFLQSPRSFGSSFSNALFGLVLHAATTTGLRMVLSVFLNCRLITHPCLPRIILGLCMHSQRSMRPVQRYLTVDGFRLALTSILAKSLLHSLQLLN